MASLSYDMGSNLGNLEAIYGRISGGAGGTRTPYLLLAKQALSLMSYSPSFALQRIHGQGRAGPRLSMFDFEHPMRSSRRSWGRWPGRRQACLAAGHRSAHG